MNVPKYDENDNDSNYPRIISHNEAHSERCKVKGVAWCPVQGGAGRDRAELASGAEDGVVSDQSEAAVSQCQPIRALCLGEDLAAGHGEGGPHSGGPVADRHRAGHLPHLEQGECCHGSLMITVLKLFTFKADPGLLLIGGESGTIVTVWDLVSTALLCSHH